ncbi:MAG: DUF2325 domain-containing protein [Burkholderiales bacterium]
MNALVVGADRLGNIPNVLEDFGIRILEHVSGRQAAHQRRGAAIARNTQLVILFTDFLGHNVMKSFRSLAQAEGVPVIACRRSASCLSVSLTRFFSEPQCSGCCGTCPNATKPAAD